MVSLSTSHHVMVNLNNAAGIDGECFKAIYTAKKAPRKMHRDLTLHGDATANTPV